MTKVCENCAKNLVWNNLKKYWECLTCSYSEGSAFEGDNY